MKRMKSSSTRLWTLAAVSAILITVSMVCPSGGVAFANSRPDTIMDTVNITRGLFIDCVQTLKTPKGRSNAEKSGICSDKDSIAQPLDSSTERGDCGWITLSMRNSGGGAIVIGESFVSTAGIMDYITWDIFWNNTDTGAANTYSNWAVPVSASYYTEQSVSTGVGYIFGKMLNSYVLLDNGTVCRGLNPQTQVRAT